MIETSCELLGIQGLAFIGVQMLFSIFGEFMQKSQNYL